MSDAIAVSGVEQYDEKSPWVTLNIPLGVSVQLTIKIDPPQLIRAPFISMRGGGTVDVKIE